MTTIWATTLGTGKARGQLERRRAARAEKAEANSKFWAIGSTRRVGRFKELRRYGGHIIAVYVMDGMPGERQQVQVSPSGYNIAPRILAYMRELSAQDKASGHGVADARQRDEAWRKALEVPIHGQ